MSSNPTPSLGRRLEALRAAPVPRGRRGMTLMEVMIVIAIILLLMGALTFGLRGMFQEAQGDTAQLQMQRIAERIQIYQVKKKKLPDNLNDVFRGEDPPVDPWGKGYVYRKRGKTGFTLMSLGADGKEGGSGTNEDIKYERD